jgi:MFS transporter, ACS family, tartrate transporter
LSKLPLMEHPTIRKAALRLLPFLFFLYVIAYLDRVNVGFAKLDMNTLPWFSESIFGFGAGIFFFGYFLFEVPSNLILEKVGARKWIARIMFTWGIISMAMALVKGVPSFYGLRFLLGVAEAGFFPGVLLYLTYWFTQKERAQVVALFMTANAVAFIIGAPLSGWITQATHNWLGLFGWQWLFILEGFPSVLFGFVVLAYLPNGPHDAKWLTPEERDYIQSRLGERTDRHNSDEPLMQGLKRDLKIAGEQLHDSRVLHCFTLFFLMVGGMYGINFWIPQIVKDMSGGGSDLIKVGLLTAIPYSISACVMVFNARHSDKTGERRLHIAIPAMIGAIAMASSGLPGLPVWARLALMAVAASGMWAILGPFWAIPQLFLRGTAMAAGLALINSVGNLAGFAGPFLVGWVKDKTGGFMYPLMVLGLFSLCGSILAILLPPSLRRRNDAEPLSQSVTEVSR